MTLHDISPEISACQSIIDWFKSKFFDMEGLAISRDEADDPDHGGYEYPFIHIGLYPHSTNRPPNYTVFIAEGNEGGTLISAQAITLEGALTELKNKMEVRLNRGYWGSEFS